MKLNSRPSIVTRRHKRQGLGYGSGKGGHTSGRGQKGQKSRNSVRLSFVGSSWVWFKRLPFTRGKSRFDSLNKALTVTLDMLNSLPAGSTVTPSTFGAKRAKLVAGGNLSKKLTVAMPATKAAVAAVEKAGGVYRGQTA